MNLKSPVFVFFGSSGFSVTVLKELRRLGVSPVLIVTTPDKPVGRGLILHESPVKRYADTFDIPIETPSTLKDGSDDAEKLRRAIEATTADISVVASYGVVIPKWLLETPPRGMLNIHPSLLPRYRGPTPIQSGILDGEKRSGVTVILMDSEIDHGPIVAVQKIDFNDLPTYEKAEEQFAVEGARLTAKILQSFVVGNIQPKAQEHEKATYTKKTQKGDAKINFIDSNEYTYRKYLAYHNAPRVFFFHSHKGKNIRVTVKEAVFVNNTFMPKTLIPEGKPEMSLENFERGYGKIQQITPSRPL